MNLGTLLVKYIVKKPVYRGHSREAENVLEIQVLGLDRHKNMVGLNWLMGSQHSPLDNWISNGNTCKHNKRKKNCTDSLPIIVHYCLRFLFIIC
jgi:hypothetical protein